MSRKTYRAGGETPGVLPHHLLLACDVLKLDVEHFCKVLAEAVGGATLDAAPGHGYECLGDPTKEPLLEMFCDGESYEPR